MARSQDDRVKVVPFSRQSEGAEVIIGRRETATYLALPADAVEILDDLAAGRTVGEAQERYRQRHGELSDVDGFVDGLQAEGFVRRMTSDGDDVAAAGHGSVTPTRFHFERFPQSVAQIIFSRPVLGIGAVLASLAVAAIVVDPSFVPGPSALFVSSGLAAVLAWVAPLFALQIGLHELAHLVAARARGVPVRFGVGHRLWLLVLETDMSGVWALPRRQRYLPMLAGPFVDAVTASGLVLTLAAEARDLITLSPVALAVLRALVVIYFYQLIWQCFFFIRTDFYYVIASTFGCKSLMADTATFVWNGWTRLTGWGRYRDQSSVPTAEMRVVRRYAFFWLGGRLLAWTLLIFVQIPIVFAYMTLLGGAAGELVRGAPLTSPVLLVPAFLGFFTFALGMFLWLRSLRLTRLQAASSSMGEKL